MDEETANLAMAAAIFSARSMIDTQMAIVKTRNFDFAPVFLETASRLFLMGSMWRVCEAFDLPMQPRLRNSVAMLGYLVSQGMSQKKATKVVQHLNTLARPNDSTDAPLVIAGYHAQIADGSLADALEEFRNDPRFAGRTFRILDRSKPIAAAAAILGASVALLVGTSWPVSLAVGVISGILPLAIALSIFHWIVRYKA